MSFYGNVTYYLSNAFKSLTLKNKAPSGTNAASVKSGGYLLVPKKKDDTLTLQTGNKWVLFGGSDADESNRTVTLFHKLSYKGGNDSNGLLGRQELQVIAYDKNNVAIENSASANAPVYTTDFGAKFTVPQVTFDQAGHLIDAATVTIELPVSDTQASLTNINNELTGLRKALTGSDTPKVLPTPAAGQSYADRITSLESRVGNWKLPANSEPQTIETALHTVLTTLGLRGQDNQGNYTLVTPAVARQDISCLLGQVATAQTTTNLLTNALKQYRNGIVALLDTLSPSTISDEREQQLVNTYFPEINL